MEGSPTMIGLQAIEAREKAATKGPWRAREEAGVLSDGDTIPSAVGPLSRAVCHGCTDEDREFIAYARTDIPALIAEVKRVQMDYREERELREYKNDCVEAGVETIRQQDDELKRHRELVKVVREMLPLSKFFSDIPSVRTYKWQALCKRIAELLKEVHDAQT